MHLLVTMAPGAAAPLEPLQRQQAKATISSTDLLPSHKLQQMMTNDQNDILLFLYARVQGPPKKIEGNGLAPLVRNNDSCVYPLIQFYIRFKFAILHNNYLTKVI